MLYQFFGTALNYGATLQEEFVEQNKYFKFFSADKIYIGNDFMDDIINGRTIDYDIAD